MSPPPDSTRRAFLREACGACAALLVRRDQRTSALASRRNPDGRLAARPGSPAPDLDTRPGEYVLPLGGSRETLLYVPEPFRPNRPAPFVLALHGATGSGRAALNANRESADRRGIVVLAPTSQEFTWDAVHGSYGEDLARIDRALGETFRRCAIDPRRLAISGFSDGATYAVSLGRVNGDLFSHVLAYSAGFIIPGEPHGKPRFFLSHGRSDPILPIDRCGRRIAAELRDEGYVVRFDEFEGGHRVTPGIIRDATTWFAP